MNPERQSITASAAGPAGRVPLRAGDREAGVRRGGAGARRALRASRCRRPRREDAARGPAARGARGRGGVLSPHASGIRDTGRDARAYLAARGLARRDRWRASARAGARRAGTTWRSAWCRASARRRCSRPGWCSARERRGGLRPLPRTGSWCRCGCRRARRIGFGGRALGDEDAQVPELARDAGLPQGDVPLRARPGAAGDPRRRGGGRWSRATSTSSRLRQAGIEDAVATAGTALTLDQCRAAAALDAARSRSSSTATRPGRRRPRRRSRRAAGRGLEVRGVTCPRGRIPTRWCRPGGRAAFDALRETARSPIEFLAERHARRPRGGAQGRDARELAALAEDPIVSGLLVEEAARTMAFDDRALQREVDLRRPGARRSRRRRGRPRRPRPRRAEERRSRARGAPRRAAHGARRARGVALEAGFLAVLVAHPELLAAAASRWIRRGSVRPTARAVAALLLGPGGGRPRRAWAIRTSRPRRDRCCRRCAPRRRASTRREGAGRGRGADEEAGARGRARADPGRVADGAGDTEPAETIAALQRRMQDTAAALRAHGDGGVAKGDGMKKAKSKKTILAEVKALAQKQGYRHRGADRQGARDEDFTDSRSEVMEDVFVMLTGLSLPVYRDDAEATEKARQGARRSPRRRSPSPTAKEPRRPPRAAAGPLRRSRAHVPARDGPGAAAHARGRGRDRQAHRGGRAPGRRGAVPRRASTLHEIRRLAQASSRTSSSRSRTSSRSTRTRPPSRRSRRSGQRALKIIERVVDAAEALRRPA